MHQLIAELGALRTELKHCVVYAKDRVEQVETEIARVRAALTGRAEELEGQAIDLADQHQDMAAAQATIDARTARAALDADQVHDAPPAVPASDPAQDDPAKGAKKTPVKATAAPPPASDGVQVDGAVDGGAAV